MSREDERHLGTADLARAGEAPRSTEPMDRPLGDPHDPAAAGRHPQHGEHGEHELHQQHQQQRHADDGARPELAALFQGPLAEEYRRRWDAIQIGFVDDPGAAVRNADELVAQVLRTLAESFADQRSDIEAGLGEAGQADTERMRIALQRYRSFFQRLLSL